MFYKHYLILGEKDINECFKIYLPVIIKSVEILGEDVEIVR
jgi:hypothetical protein